MINYPIFVLTTDNNEIFVIKTGLSGTYEVFTGHKPHDPPVLKTINSSAELRAWVKENFYDK